MCSSLYCTHGKRCTGTKQERPYVAVSKRSKVNALRRTVAAHACTIQYRVRQAILSRNKSDSHWNYTANNGDSLLRKRIKAKLKRLMGCFVHGTQLDKQLRK